jgi:peptidoglycan/xylan/chitin deacetylase (PgdA/CDA1 family)
MKAVMYHYVRGSTNRSPEYYHLDVADFRRQLDYFESEFGFADREAFLDVMKGNRETLPSGVVLTFDDGLRDHIEFVYPELEKRDLWGIFYVPTGPYENGTLLDVHRIHTLLGEVPGEKLLSHTEAVVDESMIPFKRREEYQTESYERQDNAEATTQVKRILNYFISDEYQTAVIDRLVERLGTTEPSVSSFYMTPAELGEMSDAGMIVGGHTVTHPVLSKLDADQQRSEIRDSFAFLDDAVDGLPERTFCYPYGGSFSFTDETVSILEDTACEWSFMVHQADITRSNIDTHTHSLPRYDCNEFPHGSASGSLD